MTESQTLRWIKENLAPAIQGAIKNSSYTEDWLAAMAMREVGHLIMRYFRQGKLPSQMHDVMKGDFSKREGERNAVYHGFGYWQIDVGSYPDFVLSGNWSSPTLCCMKAVAVLEEKKAYLIKRVVELQGEALEDAITAAYNCGQGNVRKALEDGKDVDVYTFNHNYSKEVRRFRELYKQLK